MRIERWYWLLAFCFLSLCVHSGLMAWNHPFHVQKPSPKPVEIEIALEPLPTPKPEPKPEPPKQKPPEPPKPIAVRKSEKPTRAVSRESAKPQDAVRPDTKTEPPRVAQGKKTVEAAPDTVEPPVVGGAKFPDRGGEDPLKEEKPLPSGLPTGHKESAPQIARSNPPTPLPTGGGGSPAPSTVPGGAGGAPGPEAPPEDILYNGGGAGGEKLPHAAPRLGGGGGKSILSVENPLAKEAVPEDKPGLGPGVGSGQGAGAGGGVGYSRGKGIGTRLNGTEALATLQHKPGAGIGAGSGSGIGTNPPGGGQGTGAELPGTGGTGTGYGRGKGVGVGNGSGVGMGDGPGGSIRMATKRGVPFGDVTGLLKGDPNGGGGRGGGPGGTGSGSIFGIAPTRTGNGHIYIVYVLDISGSMREANKIGKAQEALKNSLWGLRPTDSFNIITFNRRIMPYIDALQPASLLNKQEAANYVDGIRLGDGTNIEHALRAAFAMEGITHITLLSDGEPNVGETNFDKLRQLAKELNTRKIQVNTLFLGIGETSPGMALLKGLAEDNGGEYKYQYLGGDSQRRRRNFFNPSP